MTGLACEIRLSARRHSRTAAASHALAGAVVLTVIFVMTQGLFAPGNARAGTAVDLELVLAVDASGSIDVQEFTLQLEGIAAAFRDCDVIAATRSGPLGRIGVMMLIWSDAHLPTAATAWHVIDGAAAAERFAIAVRGFPRSIVDNGTGIGNALRRAREAMEDNGLDGMRLIIDVSGDGRENAADGMGTLVAKAQKDADAHGIEINGLAILSQEPDLADYYRRHVIAGPAAFVIAIDSFADFARAMRLKLLREIGRGRLSEDVPTHRSKS